MTVQLDRWREKRAAVCGANGKKVRDLPAFQIRNGNALSFFARLFFFHGRRECNIPFEITLSEYS